MLINKTARAQCALQSSKLLTGVVAALALFSAACSDATSPVASAVRQVSATRNLVTSDFALLANAAVTCTDGNVTGSVGTDQAQPTGKVTQTNCPISGSIDVGTAASQAAYDAFVARYDALAPVPGECTTKKTLTGTLAGVTLAPGTYCLSAEAKTGVLTLTGSGPWTFKVLGALTGNSFTVLLKNPTSNVCDVTWWVEAASTMTTSNFIGTIMAGAAITLTGSTFAGNAWSKAGVTITGTTVTGCAGGSSIPGAKEKCNQGVGNGPEGCDPGKSSLHNGTNDEDDGMMPGKPGRKNP